MPKRTNAFQRLIHYIHEQSEGADARVIESAPLLEKNVEEPIKREVDVLIEKEVNGKLVRIAIECRDRKVRDDIQWIDNLIGKYQHLEVHKVIAVSSSGFTGNARLKAEANNIELRTLEEALAIDFQNEFVKLGMVRVSWTFSVRTVAFEFEPLVSDRPTLRGKLYRDGQETGTLGDLARFCFEEAKKKRLRDYTNKSFFDVLRTREDLNKPLLVEHTLPIKGLYFKSGDNTEHRVVHVVLTLVGRPHLSEKMVKHRLYDGALVSEAVFDEAEISDIRSIRVAQVRGKKEGKVFFTRKRRN